MKNTCVLKNQQQVYVEDTKTFTLRFAIKLSTFLQAHENLFG